MTNIAESRFKHLDYLIDKWRKKPSINLSKKKALEILIDECKFDSETKEFTEIKLENLKKINGWYEMSYKLLEQEKNEHNLP